MPPDTPPESSETWAPNTAPDPDQPTRVPLEPAGDPSDPPAAGRRYREVGLLGRGGIAEVRSAHDDRLGREVAVKRLQHLMSRTGRRRFLREARVTAQLEHPGIVPVYDADVDADGVPFYTMKYVRGRPLSHALYEAKGLQGRLQLLPAFASVCQAMAYAHSRRVIHRDLKPDNIMLGEFGEALVVDWGLARALDDAEDDDVEPQGDASGSSLSRPVSIDGTPLTLMGQIAGTPAYMAPEQASGAPTTPATDVFALGAILYQLLTGTPPHGVADDLEEQLERARTGRIVPVRKRSPYAPPDLAAIAERALAHHPSDRYPSAEELSRDLERWRNGRLVEAYAYTPWEHVTRLLVAYRVPLVLAGLGLASVVVVGIVGITNTVAAQRRAEENERQALAAVERANRDLATMLSERAKRAWAQDDAPSSRAFAAASLALVDAPETRGLFASAWAQDGLAYMMTDRLPHPCSRLVLASDSDDLFCAGETWLSRLSPEGQARWSTKLPVAHELVHDGERLWIGTDQGALQVDASDGRILHHAPGGVVQAMLARGDGALRYDEWRPEGYETVFWHPPDAPRRETYDESGVTDRAWWNDQPLRLHVAGYLSVPGRGRVGSVDHVAYDMARVTDGWLVVGTSTTLLGDDGAIRPITEVDQALGEVVANDRNQFAATGSDHSILVFDLNQRRRVAWLPPASLKPGIDIDSDHLITAHGDILRRWRLPAPHPEGVWKAVATDDTGERSLFCDQRGRALLRDASGRFEVLPTPATEGTLKMCLFVDGLPTASWSDVAYQWNGPGAPREIPLRRDGVVRLDRVGPHLVQTDAHGVWFGAQQLGDALLPRPTGAPADVLVVQSLAEGALKWLRATSDGFELVRELDIEDGRRVIAVLADGRAIDAPYLSDGPGARIVSPSGTVPLPAHPLKVISAQVLGDRWLVTGDRGGTLRLWDLTDLAEPVAHIRAHDARVTRIYVIGQGSDQHIVSDSYDGSQHRWSVDALLMDADEVVARVRARDQLEVAGGELRLVEPPL